MIRFITACFLVSSSVVMTAVPIYNRAVFAQPAQESIEQILDRVSDDNGFNRGILRAIALQESGGYIDNNRVKCEPQLLRATKQKDGKFRAAITPPAGLNQIERELWASSHGVLQIIYGFHYKECGLPLNGWDKLHDPETNIRCGATILKSNLARYRSIADAKQRLWSALRDYNGSEEYADKVIVRIALLNNINLGKGI